jgi:catechol 2,3-dioxygenase-like lactoylglutathione lyase family enzyme
MRLTRIVLPVSDVAGLAAFYGDVLGLPVESSDAAAAVQVGTTRLELRASAPLSGAHHLAFTIPVHTLTAARAWLERRAQLLTRGDQDEFEGPPAWNSRSVYFSGPDGSVLELIERRDLDVYASGPFSSADLLCVSEVGVAVQDVRALAAKLAREAEVRPYGSPAAEDFAAVGDVHGLLILVSPGRLWLPTNDRSAAVVPTALVAQGARSGRYSLGELSTLELK